MAQSNPNLVFVFADQLGYRHCGYAGSAKARTPNIDRLAAEGVSFRQAVSVTPVCAAFRSSLFTGQYTTTTGMVINELRMNPNRECIGHVLTRAGYDTSYIGKWHLWANELGNHDDPKNACIPPGPHRLGFDGFWAAYNFHHDYFGACCYRDEPVKIPWGDATIFEPDAQTDMAIERVRAMSRGGRPFALFLSWGTPHDPWRRENVPAKWLEPFLEVDFPRPANYAEGDDPYADKWGRFRPGEREQLGEWQRVYYAMTANVDHNLGRLLDAVDAAGLGEDTLVVFTSDHGEMFGAHGRKAKNIFYEEAARVPMLLRQRGRIPAGATSDACLNTPDIMPTVLGLLGLAVPTSVEGMDLSHCAEGREGAKPEAALMQNTGACAAWEDGHEWRALRDARYTYAAYRVDGAELLFDNVADPLQMTNLAREASARPLLERFRAMLKARMAEIEDTNETCTWYRDHWTKDRIILCGARG